MLCELLWVPTRRFGKSSEHGLCYVTRDRLSSTYMTTEVATTSLSEQLQEFWSLATAATSMRVVIGDSLNEQLLDCMSSPVSLNEQLLDCVSSPATV
ncbi:hypothetical protein C0Q70_20202 [Pomacea canaliculata]|uniref:Uncharacterized protein n=1 Tax=Pomacea canaliculata TaxID=400727 RepID=A0A2T7NEX1_POMCA|nr:hypothetical protein C0Q70_20202 [Pomacea canaliculata]